MIFPSVASLNPSPLSRVELAPGIPSNCTTSAFSPTFSNIYSPASFPPSTLLLAIKLTISPESVPLSTQITGIFASFAFSTDDAIAVESTGFIIIKSTPWVIKSSTWLLCVDESFCASEITVSASSPAPSSIPSLIDTKNGLLSVESETPIFIFPSVFLSAVSFDSVLFSVLVLLSSPSKEQAVNANKATSTIDKYFLIVFILLSYLFLLRSIRTAIKITIPFTIC